MADPLLSYSITTDPLPLQINVANASIVIAASNPGFYSDKPDTNYVAPTQVIFSFGDLLTSNPSTIAASVTYTPKNGSPVQWPAPTRTGAQFTFNLPTGAKIFPGDSLSFGFNNVAVGSQIASVGLSLTETASAPGDPAYPGGYYPAMPSMARFTSRQIGIFPVNFSIDTLTSSPTTVGPGLPTQLSWSASKLANTSFSLVYAANGAVQTVTQHADGTPLQATDTYPNSANDPGLVLSINRTTTFSLQATYVQSGTRVTAEKQVTVSVPDPTINTFTATPSTGLMVGDAVQLVWQTLAADYVTINPPLDGVHPTVPNSGSATIYPLQYNRYMLTASGRGLNVHQSLVLFPMSPGWTTATGRAPWLAGLAPLTLAVNGLIWVLPGTPSSQSNPVYSSPDGQNWIMVKPDAGFPVRKNAGSLSNLSNGTAWVMGGIGKSGAALNDVWSTTDGKTWTQVTGSAQWSARSDFGCVWFNNLYWIMGGVDGNGNFLNDIWTSPDGVAWTKKSGTPAWSARSAFALTVFNGSLWIFGGRSASGVDSGFWTSSDGVNWQDASSDPFGTTPSARTQGKLFGHGSGSIYLIGGIGSSGNGLIDAWAWSADDNWQSTIAPPVPASAKYFGSTVSNGGLWLTGGGSDNAFGSGVWVLVPV